MALNKFFESSSYDFVFLLFVFLYIFLVIVLKVTKQPTKDAKKEKWTPITQGTTKFKESY